MQTVRCLKFFHQCSPKAAEIFRCFWTKQNAVHSPQRTGFGQLYQCTRTILNDSASSQREKSGDSADSEDIKSERRIEDTSMEYFSSLVASPSHKDTAIERRLKAKASNLGDLKPALPVHSGSIASYVNESETLTKLTHLGVDLSIVERNTEATNHILKADFERDVQPYLEFLLDMGVLKNDLKTVITKNPAFFMEDLESLEVRVNYLRSKLFTDEAIARILTKAPLFLTHEIKQVDKSLGILQKLFSLKGDEVRQAITAYPKLTTWPIKRIEDSYFIMKEYLGFTQSEQRQMLLFQPKVYTTNRNRMEAVFDLLHNTIGLSHADICQWPQIFRTRTFIIKQRHQFLHSIDRAQYDPKKPNFVSLKALVSGRDIEFCENVAKVPVTQYNSFLKGL